MRIFYKYKLYFKYVLNANDKLLYKSENKEINVKIGETVPAVST